MTEDEADIYANFGLHGLRLYRSNVEETKDQLTSALARVEELEGLEVWNGQLKEGGRWLEVFVPFERIGENATTLGQAMPGGAK